jgi:hypothetical protein
MGNICFSSEGIPSPPATPVRFLVPAFPTVVLRPGSLRERSSTIFETLEYHDFAEKRHTTEIPHCIKAIKDYQKDYDTLSSIDRWMMAYEIYRKFIMESAPDAVNISDPLRRGAKLELEQLDDPRKEVFDEIVKEVKKLGKLNYYKS